MDQTWAFGKSNSNILHFYIKNFAGDGHEAVLDAEIPIKEEIVLEYGGVTPLHVATLVENI